MHLQTLELRETTVLGHEHPDTLDSISNLALVLNSQKRYKDAEKHQRQALEGYRRVLGQEHLDTLDGIYKLAVMLKNQGKYAEAGQMYREALGLMEKVLGDEHPSTKRCRRNHARCLKAGEEASRRGL